jgi:signal transduction histidine kinase
MISIKLAAPFKNRLYESRDLISWSILAIAFGLLTVMIVSDVIVSRGNEERLSKRESNNILSLTAGSIEPIFDKAELVLKNTITNYTQLMRDSSEVEIAKVNKELYEQMADFKEAVPGSLRLINANGDVVYFANNKDASTNLNVSDKSYFLAQKSNNSSSVMISDPIFSQLTGKWIIALSKKFTLEDGSFAGIAQISIKTDSIQEIFDKVSIGDKSGISLVAKDGSIVLRSPVSKTKMEHEYRLDDIFLMLSKGVRQGSVYEKSAIDGNTHLVSYKKLYSVPFILTVGIAPDDYLNDWTKKAILYCFIWLFVLYIMGSLWYITNNAKRDKKLMEKAIDENRESNRMATVISELMKNSSGSLLVKINNLKTILSGMNGKDGREYKRLVDLANNCGNDIIGTVTNTSLLVEIESKKLGNSAGHFNVNSLFQDLISQQEIIARHKEVEFFKDFGANCKYEIIGNISLIYNSVETLLTNAVKHTASGRVVIQMDIIKNEESCYLHIEVSDSGIGFRKEALDSINMMFKEPDSVEIDSLGINLKLLTLAKAIKFLNGSIALVRNKQAKTVFSFYVPVKLA